MRQLKISKSITKRDSASLDRYLAEISKLTMITAEEESELARKIREGDDTALTRMVSANLRFVVSVAKQYQNNGIKLEDLINEGNVGLIKAARRFDETRGFKFISYAVWWIRQSIIQAISEQSRVIRLPLNKITVLNKIKKAQDIMEQQLERTPTTDELSAVLDISAEEIKASMEAAVWHTSTDNYIIPGEDMTLLDIIPSDSREFPDHPLLKESKSKDIERVLATLTGREAEIIILFYGIGLPEALTLEEIGERYDLSRERVRQIKEKAIRELRKTFRSSLLIGLMGD